MAEPAGRKVSRFEIVSELARGGMGVVYLASQPSLGRHVVLKALHRDLGDDPREEQRFEREASAVAALHHPNVVGVYDCFRWRGRLFIAQEFVDGIDLGSVLERTGPFPPRIASLVALEIARGLEEIHGRGLVHRDLKPGNVLLGRAGQVKLADFGIALDARGPKLTRTGTSLGTPAYMSPEQIQGARLDFRSDVFSFGVLLYELLSGALPFGEPAAETTPLLGRIEAGRARPLRRAAPRTPLGLARLVHRCLRAEPARRVRGPAELRRRLERRLGSPSAADARRELADWLAARKALPAVRGRTVRAARTARPARAKATRWAAAAAALLLLGALGAGWIALAQAGGIPARWAGGGPAPAPEAVSAEGPSAAPPPRPDERSARLSRIRPPGPW